MFSITAANGKFLTNGSIYISGTLYLPAETDAVAWTEVDRVVEDKALTSDEVLRTIFGSTGEVRESTARKAQKTLSTIQTLGGLKSETVQSDKIGFDWRNIYVGDVLVRQEYVEQEHPTGTVDNPIVYADGVPLINNAYYLKDDALYVWMNEWVKWEADDAV
nr:MAG TPA: hypothetical protein [Caudoviricetes sp.]